MPSLLPPSEDRYLAQYVCDELSKVIGDKREDIIRQSAKDILKDLIKTDKSLAREVRKELFNCYSKIFTKDDDLPKID